MERRRKGYLLRKNDYFDHLNYSPQTNGNAVCSCNKSSARSYDLQTQTITFEEEPPIIRQREAFLPSARYTEDHQKVSESSIPMDQDLEFYPIDDHPSPSTFTAWDAFLAGNQAFFREPPGLLPDPAFSYMDVIPEEDDLEALLESDTDDTGSSVSTVIDRFSRTSTANSSFSERCKGTANITFDLQKVLSPFERLEKEFEDESKDESLRKKEISRGPIVVITNSSSCEDVHSADEEETFQHSEKLNTETNNDPVIENCSTDKISVTIVSSESSEFSTVNESKICENSQKLDNTSSNSSSKDVVSKAPTVPARSKLSNGSKISDKSRIKSDKIENTSPSSSKKKKSYPTPSVPPRMSKHLPARRTRSDPGTPDQPSRIPRPISNTTRSPTTSTASKSTPKNNKSSPNSNSNKKIKLFDSSKSNKSVKISSAISESSVSENKIDFDNGTTEKSPETPAVEEEKLNTDVKGDGFETIKDTREDNADCASLCETDNLIETIETYPNVSTTVFVGDESIKEESPLDCDLFPPMSEFAPASSTAEEHKTNPFKKNDTNPFKSDIESQNPFVVCNNSFEDSPEITPVLQPKGQMSASLIAPPIPERPSLRKKQENVTEPEKSNSPEPPEAESVAEPESIIDSPPTETEEIFVDSNDVADPPVDISPVKTGDILSTLKINDAIEAALQDMDILDEKVVFAESSPDPDLKHDGDAIKDNPESKLESGCQRPIEDILQALDQLVLSAPREVEISIDWGMRGDVNIREKTVLPSDSSGDRSEISETDGLTDDRKRDIETLLKEVDECLKLQKASEDLSAQQPTDSPLPASDSIPSATERITLSPGSPDAPTAGSTTLSLSHNEDQGTQDTDILLEHPPPAMLKHQSQSILAPEQRVYSAPYQEIYSKTIEQLDEEAIANKHNSAGCDDSGVFLEDPISSSPENQSRSNLNRLQSTLEKLSDESPKMRQYSIHEGLDSDAEKSDDLGLASSSIDSADDLDGDPLPSTLQITSCPPVVTSKQKPPPVPARKSVSKSSDYQKNNRYFSEITTLEVPNYQKTPLSKSSSSGEDSNFGEGAPEYNSSIFSLNEKSKNILNQQKNEQSRSNFAMTRSFHEEMLLNQQRDMSQDSKSNFLARTLNNTGKHLDVPNGTSLYSRRNMEQPSSFKWKSEECLRTAAESKWSIPGRRYEKSVSVKDRIAMFSEMEANQSSSKKEDLQRYGSENNIKALAGITESKKMELPLNENKSTNLSKDFKWHSMHSIAKKETPYNIEKETPYINTNMKPAISIPSLTSNNIIDNIPNSYSTLPVKLDVEPPKPIVSTYPETQLTNNKRYNYGLYSLKNLKNTENLLSKKAAGANFLSIIDSRKQPTQKLKGLVIPEKPYQPNGSNELPTIVSSDSDGSKETRRASLPITAVTAAKAMSLPRNKKLECVPAQRQTSLTEPPWKSDNSTNYALPKYSPAFRKRSLELPGSSLSPTPPSSITSPMSPPPSSPSSICSSNASSTIQQNVFQFSLSHSKPVQPLQPEKALMSPPSLPSDVEYEGDNSEDSSHSASPMRSSSRSNKETKQTSLQDMNQNVGKPNAFTSTAKNVLHQPMMVETLAKSSPPPEMETPKPKAAIYLSKTEIMLKKDEPRPDILSHDQDFVTNELISNSSKSIDQTSENPAYKTNGVFKHEIFSKMKPDVLETQIYEKKNGDIMNSHEYYSNGVSSQNGEVRNGGLPTSQSFMSLEDSQINVPVGKFRALPVNLKETDAKSEANNNDIQNLESRQKSRREPSFWGNDHPHSGCEESDDDDSHSTLSHRTEDSRHVTTDDCLSDATTDSFEKPRLIPEPPISQRIIDDNMSTEGYLSDASTDVSIRRFTNCTAYSTEEYLSDATADSPDPDWISQRGSMDQNIYSRPRSYGRNETIHHPSNHVRDEEKSENSEKNVDLDLKPRRLSQQRTVLKASAEPSGSAQKFKALAEKWEQRADVISPPPPIVAPLISKKESKVQSIAAGMISSTVIKGKSTLPPSLMPRSNVSEKKTSQSSKSASKESVFAVRTSVEKEMIATSDGLIARKSLSSTSTVIETTNRWNPHQYDELPRLESSSRRDSISSASSSSKTTLKDDEVFDLTPPLQPEIDCSDVKFDAAVPPTMNARDNMDTASQSPSQVSVPTRQDDIFSNEPRNRRGVDFSRTTTIPDWSKPNRPSFGTKSTFSVSDIRGRFENGSKEADKPLIPPKKAPMPAARMNAAVPAVQPPPIPRRKVSLPSEEPIEVDDELRMFAESARNQLYDEGVSNKFDVLTVVLRREGEGGGSVGITLAGGADYEVKEITVHKVISGSIADRDGRVLKGDRVMSINGRDLRGVSHGEALHILKAPSPKVVLVIARDKSGPPLQQNGTLEKEVRRRNDSSNHKDSEMFVVQLLKDATGLGFSIEGGKDSPQGDRPLLIKRIFKGGAADKDGHLEEGDEIVFVNDQPVNNMTRTEAWNFLKKLPEGPVLLRARKSNAVA